MNWKAASLSQLHLINSEFEDCPVWYKQQAQEEINRRRRKVHGKLQQKERKTNGQ